MAERGKGTPGRGETMLLRGANGMLYRIPVSELERYAVPPEQLDKAIKALEAVNPLLAAREAEGGAAAKGPQVVINIYTSAEGAVSITSEAGGPAREALSAAQFPMILTGPVCEKKTSK